MEREINGKRRKIGITCTYEIYSVEKNEKDSFFNP